ncbi:MAG: ribosome small subunit-dependent GTPase A [Clostridia bacterium]|nr:ribosome small subunit-dependent GTPase A [Clostridia bacterium]
MKYLKRKQGIIIKGIGGFYYVKVTGQDMIVQCTARGRFRKDKQSPVIGDRVEVDIISESKDGLSEGAIEKILPRRNILKRPRVSNIDKVAIVVTMREPDANLYLLDKMLVFAEKSGLDIVIVVNKIDLATSSEINQITEIYRNIGYDVIATSLLLNIGVQQLREQFKGCTTVLAGQSGVGKSSILNRLAGKEIMEIGVVSKKIRRGKHTTRHSELIKVYDDSFIVDTPGFSSLDLADIDSQELQCYFIDFRKYIPLCRFKGCSHMHEPGCAIKQAVKDNEISRKRYKRYKDFMEEIAIGGMNKW